MQHLSPIYLRWFTLRFVNPPSKLPQHTHHLSGKILIYLSRQGPQDDSKQLERKECIRSYPTVLETANKYVRLHPYTSKKLVSLLPRIPLLPHQRSHESDTCHWKIFLRPPKTYSPSIRLQYNTSRPIAPEILYPILCAFPQLGRDRTRLQLSLKCRTQTLASWAFLHWSSSRCLLSSI